MEGGASARRSAPNANPRTGVRAGSQARGDAFARGAAGTHRPPASHASGPLRPSGLLADGGRPRARPTSGDGPDPIRMRLIRFESDLGRHNDGHCEIGGHREPCTDGAVDVVRSRRAGGVRQRRMATRGVGRDTDVPGPVRRVGVVGHGVGGPGLGDLHPVRRAVSRRQHNATHRQNGEEDGGEGRTERGHRGEVRSRQRNSGRPGDVAVGAATRPPGGRSGTGQGPGPGRGRPGPSPGRGRACRPRRARA